MTDSFAEEWRKELRLLLDHIASHPTHDLAEQRARVVVLNKLLEEHAAKTAA
jgi:hypothetical protein